MLQLLAGFRHSKPAERRCAGVQGAETGKGESCFLGTPSSSTLPVAPHDGARIRLKTLVRQWPSKSSAVVVAVLALSADH